MFLYAYRKIFVLPWFYAEKRHTDRKNYYSSIPEQKMGNEKNANYIIKMYLYVLLYTYISEIKERMGERRTDNQYNSAKKGVVRRHRTIIVTILL